jgi:hypothetical protein
MNERIEELKKEAFRQTEWEELDYDNILEKFAELIVLECVKLYNHVDVMAPVGNSAWGEAYQEGWVEGTQRYKETIEEHFGVEK